MAKALVEACDAKQVALHEPLLTMLLDATTTRRSSPGMADNQDGQADALRLLIEGKADLSITSEYGTALDAAEKWGGSTNRRAGRAFCRL